MEDTTDDGSIPTASLYAAAIAVVSGAYSVLLATGGAAMTVGVWVMLVVGAVAIVHGIALLTPAASRLGAWSGPLMIGYAIVMLVNRAVMPMGRGSMSGGMMNGGGAGGMMGGSMGTMGSAGGAGMIALALLMLVSGVVMTVRSDERM